VKTTLCNFCLRSGILCSKCQKKLRTGEITDDYLKTARTLLSLENAYPSLQNVTLHKIAKSDGILVIVVGRGDVAPLLGYGGKIIKELGKELGKRIHVLEYGVEDRKFLEDLFAPLNIVTINTIWLPDGTIDTRVILKRERRRSKIRNLKALKEIAKKIQGITLRVEFAN
jgi:transcription antitermination factor NusA-like protein